MLRSTASNESLSARGVAFLPTLGIAPGLSPTAAPLYHLQRIWWDQADAAVVAEGEEVTLMGWGNAIVRKISKREDDTVESIEAGGHVCEASSVVWGLQITTWTFAAWIWSK